VLELESVTTRFIAELQQVRMVILLRWVLILAASYLVLFSYQSGPIRPSVGLFVAAYLASNLALQALVPRLHSLRVFGVGVVIFDIAALSTGLALTGHSSADFFPVYFLVIFLGAFTERLGLAVSAAVLVSVVHLATVSRFVGLQEMVNSGYMLRIPFLLVVSLFFGFLVEDTRLRQRAHRARARQRRRIELLSAVTHDFKNPLGNIQSLASMLLNDDAAPLSSQQTELVRRVHANARRVIQLSVNLLDAAQIDAGRLTLHRRPANVADLARDVVALVRTGSDLKGVTVHLSVPAEVLTLDIDSLQIERVVSNLLDNAIKYTPSGGSIAVTVAPRPGEAVIEVRDDGPGIPANDLPIVFEKFRRRPETSRIEGSGFGLFIVKAIVAAHGGTVDIASAPGRGTTVAVHLPTTRPQPHTDVSTALTQEERPARFGARAPLQAS